MSVVDQLNAASLNQASALIGQRPPCFASPRPSRSGAGEISGLDILWAARQSRCRRPW